MQRRISLRVVSDCDLSLFEQVKSQVISSLFTGRIRDGDALPSVRELAPQARVNPKTVLKVYRDLQRDGLLELETGRGAFVRQRGGSDATRLRRQAVVALIRSSLEKASLLGLRPDRFSRLLARYATGTGLEPLVVALVDDPEELAVYSAELSRRLRAEVEAVPLAEAGRWVRSDNPRVVRCSHVLTTSWHLESVRPLADALGRPLLEIRPNPAIYQGVVAELQHRNVGVVVGDPRTLHVPFDVFRNLFLPNAPGRFLVATVGDGDRLAEMAASAAVVFASPGCRDAVRQAMPAGVDVRTVQDVIADECIEELRIRQVFQEGGES